MSVCPLLGFSPHAGTGMFAGVLRMVQAKGTTVTDSSDPVTTFIEAAVWHGSLERAEAILAAHPKVAGSGIHAAAVLGDDAAVRRFLALDPGSATAKREPYGGDSLVYLC